MRQLDVLDDRLVLVPLRLDRVGGGQHRRPRVQRTDDSRLRDRQRLLLLQSDTAKTTGCLRTKNWAVKSTVDENDVDCSIYLQKTSVLS